MGDITEQKIICKQCEDSEESKWHISFNKGVFLVQSVQMLPNCSKFHFWGVKRGNTCDVDWRSDSYDCQVKKLWSLLKTLERLPTWRQSKIHSTYWLLSLGPEFFRNTGT